jgi:hypothetical protein
MLSNVKAVGSDGPKGQESTGDRKTLQKLRIQFVVPVLPNILG